MGSTSSFNYYDILEINQDCPPHEIVGAYERLKLTYGGDNPAIFTIFSKEEAKEMLKMVEEAFATLNNKLAKSEYDERLNVGQKPPTAPQVKAVEGPTKSVYRQPEYKRNANFEAEILEWSDWNGAKIKKVREYRGWSVEALAERTKISSYYLKAVESMTPKELPAPVFVRGFVAQVCKILGLDEKRVCDSYMKSFKNI